MLANQGNYPSRPSKWLWTARCFAVCAITLAPAHSAEEVDNVTDETKAANVEALKRNQELALDREKIVGSAPLIDPPPPVAEPEKLIARSAILCFNEVLTLVPKQAVIYVPPDFEGRLKATGDPKIVDWSTFSSLNKGWITSFEITLQQAEGKIAIPAEAFKRMKKEGNVVIATLEGNPITILPSTILPAVQEVPAQTIIDK